MTLLEFILGMVLVVIFTIGGIGFVTGGAGDQVAQPAPTAQGRSAEAWKEDSRKASTEASF